MSGMVGETVPDDVLVLEPSVGTDAEEWLGGEEEEQSRWFEARRPAQRSDSERFITECREAWRKMGDYRRWGTRRRESRSLVGGVHIRDRANGEVSLALVASLRFRRQGVVRRASPFALNGATTPMGARSVVTQVRSENVSSATLALVIGAASIGGEPPDAGKARNVVTTSLPRAWLPTPREVATWRRGGQDHSARKLATQSPTSRTRPDTPDLRHQWWTTPWVPPRGVDT
ncbi:MAG: GNAT family N-acetyltransferase [Acidimicrobiales bacterium]